MKRLALARVDDTKQQEASKDDQAEAGKSDAIGEEAKGDEGAPSDAVDAVPDATAPFWLHQGEAWVRLRELILEEQAAAATADARGGAAAAAAGASDDGADASDKDGSDAVNDDSDDGDEGGGGGAGSDTDEDPKPPSAPRPAGMSFREFRQQQQKKKAGGGKRKKKRVVKRRGSAAAKAGRTFKWSKLLSEMFRFTIGREKLCRARPSTAAFGNWGIIAVCSNCRCSHCVRDLRS